MTKTQLNQLFEAVKHICVKLGFCEREKIRKARKSDYEFIAWTVYKALGIEPHRTSQMQRTCIQDDTLYSWKNATLLFIDGKPVAGIIAYPGDKYKGLQKHTFPYCWDKDACFNVDANTSVTECQPNEYYIDSLAVLSEYRCKGYARKLLQKTEREAKKKGFRKISLLVDKKHLELIRYYGSMGYFEKDTIKFLDRNFVKMIKNI